MGRSVKSAGYAAMWRSGKAYPWAVIIACAVLAFVVPVALYLMPISGGDGFVTGWRLGVLVVALLVDAAGAALFWRSQAVRMSLVLRAAMRSVMGLASLVAVGTMVVTFLLAPPAPQKKAVPTAVKGGAAKGRQPAGKPAGGASGAKPGGAPSPLQAVASTPAAQAQGQEQKKPTMPPPKPPEEMSKGEQLVRDKCLGCHRFQGYGFGASDDLDKAAQTHTMSWFIQLLRDPVNVGKKGMPKLALSDGEIFEISSYIAGRGGPKGQQQDWFGGKQIDQSQMDLVHAGQKAFGALNCYGCHKIGDQGGTTGPDLSKEGQKRDAAWIAAFLSDYFTKGSAMPFLAMSQDDINGLAAYLASLK